MAVHYIQGSNPLGTIGGIASLAGTLAGVPWLVPVGMGLGIAGNVMNGQGVSAQDVARMAGSLNGVAGTSTAANPASAANNPVVSSASNLDYPVMSDEETSDFMKKWSRGGYRGSYRSSL